jgi:hypothetical protein
MSNAIIGALRVTLGADTAAFDRGLKKAETGLSKFAATATKVLGALGVAFGAQAFAGMIKGTMDAIDAQAKLARAIGGTIAGLQGLERSATRSGIQSSEMTAAVTRLNQALGKAIIDGKGTDGVFKRLGISAQALSRMDVDERLIAISDAMKAAGMSTQEMSATLRELGIRQTSMVTLMQGGAEEIRRSRQAIQEYGAALTKIDTDKIERANDAIADIGIVFQGLRNRIAVNFAEPLERFANAITASARAGGALRFVLDGLVLVGSALAGAVDLAARALETLNQHMDTIAVAASTAGSMMLVAFGPTLLAAMNAVVYAVGTAMVGAMRALTAAMMANPMIAFAVALTAAVTAAYHFRDEIQKAIGVDVVQIAKDAGNLIIGSFVAAYEDIKFVWEQFPNVIAAAMIGAVNFVIDGVNRMVNASLEGLNVLIGAFNALPFLEIGLVDTSGTLIDPIANNFTDALQEGLEKRSKAVAEAIARDYIGELTNAFQASVPAAIDFDLALGDLGEGLERVAGGGKAAAQALNQLMAEGERVRLSVRTPLEELQETIARLNQLLDAGAISWETYTRAVDQAQQKFEEAQNKGDNLAQSLGQQFSSMFEGLISGTKSAGEAIADLLKQLARLLINRAFNMLFGEGGALSGLFSFGGFRANGGPVQSGRAYVVGERGPELFVPNSGGSVVKNSDLGGGSVTVQPVFQVVNNATGMVNVRQEQDGNVLRAVIETVEGAMAGNVANGRGPLRAALNARPAFRG